MGCLAATEEDMSAGTEASTHRCVLAAVLSLATTWGACGAEEGRDPSPHDTVSGNVAGSTPTAPFVGGPAPAAPALAAGEPAPAPATPAPAPAAPTAGAAGSAATPADTTDLAPSGAVACMDTYASTTRNGQPMTDACKACMCQNCQPQAMACYSFAQGSLCNAITQCYTTNKVLGSCGRTTDDRIGVDGLPQVDCYFGEGDVAGAVPTGPCMSEIDTAAGGQQANWDGACLLAPMTDNACAASTAQGECMNASCYDICGWQGGACTSNWC